MASLQPEPLSETTMTTHAFDSWLLRLPFAAVFIFHGAGKLAAPVMSADMLSLPLPLVLLVGMAEVLAGLGAVVGGWPGAPKADLVTRLAGVAAIPVLLGAIVLVHAPRWSFVPTESHPMGGMEFQVVLLGLALYFALVGAPRKALPRNLLPAATAPVRS
jgi:putative oxidoreductase